MMRALAAILSLCLVACTGSTLVAPKSPAQAVFELKATEAAAITIALQYKALPSCALPAHPVVCADPAIVQRVQQADTVAAAAIDGAEAVVRTPGSADKASAAIAAANNAVAVLTAITTTLKVK